MRFLKSFGAVLLLFHAVSAKGSGSDARPAAVKQAGPNFEMGAPVLGFAPDPATRGIRPMFGSPASVNWGAPLELGLTPGRLAVSPSQNYVFAWISGTRAAPACGARQSAAAPDHAGGRRNSVAQRPSRGGEHLLLIVLGIREPAACLAGDFDRVVFSPAGKSAALLSGTQVQIVTGLPDSLTASFDFDLGALPDRPVLRSVSDDGVFAVAGPSGEGAGPIWIAARDATQRFVLTGLTASVAQFVPGSHDVVAADRTSNTAYYVREANGSYAISMIASEEDGIDDPVAIETSLDRKQVIIANRRPNSIVLLKLDGTRGSIVFSESGVEGLIRFQGNAVFQINLAGAEPVIFDGDTNEPRILAAPAYPPSERDGGAK